LLFFGLFIGFGIPAIIYPEGKEEAQPVIDISGEWIGDIPKQFTNGREGEKIIFALQIKEGEVTGSVVAFQSESEITDGKISKNKISFKSKLLPSGQSADCSFKGEIISKDSIDMEMKGGFFPGAQTFKFGIGGTAPISGPSGIIKLQRTH
jgi:hypothetical protein